MDFTINKIGQLYQTLLQQDFYFIAFQQYVQGDKPEKFIILRHDVEKQYQTALKFAQIQHNLGIKGTYYFRILPRCFKPEIVKQIADLGHEVGYHYDDLAYCKGDHDKAIKRFEKNLNTLRELAEVKTICMDGSPLSKYDNKDLWNHKAVRDVKTRDKKVRDVAHHLPLTAHHSSLITHHSPLISKYDYKNYGIFGDPYFDIDFDEVFYLTDTGRRWDGWKVSLRDKVSQQEQWIKQGLTFHSTDDIIRAANAGRLSDKIMFTFHPQRWNDKPLPWMKELVWQNVKNVGKRFLLRNER